MNMAKKTFVFYHANCTDGFASAFAAFKFFEGRAEYLPINYGKYSVHVDELTSNVNGTIYKMRTNGAQLIFVDFCPKWQDIRTLELHAESILILDHHKTAKED